MQFESPLVPGVLLRRYQRFLADVRLADGSTVTAHTPNTGSMKGCCEPGSRVWLRDSGSATRKYPFSWELVEAAPDVLVGINTGLANALVREAVENGVVQELQGYRRIRQEVRYGEENSRIDLLLERDDGGLCYVEVKNVTLVEGGIALFPDAVSSRGAKHLRELAAMVRQGHRAVIFYCVQRRDAGAVSPADGIDPLYGRTLREALAQGVEALAYRAEVGTEGIALREVLAVVCP
ncbi:DNA/RNA nuclease SfsA [Methylogaea oryzae]|uniref:Sugar fermentation stimulation protein homolog n=1 Tax=Methylogaea oryzae TaxID=1295382 RepID=A0A8D4VU75_9GAMM|nr:DNA/RNA nuclease SfsA [Methylogaea oryzae]BBL72589.1 sugar fermentation stimulation protein [Methylogaea oryzae]